MKLLNLIFICILFVTSYSAQSNSGGEQSSSDSTSVCGHSAVNNNRVRESQAKVKARRKLRQSRASGIPSGQTAPETPTP